MRRNWQKQLLAAVVAVSMLAENAIPALAMAEEVIPAASGFTAVFSEAAAGHESELVLTAGNDFNGTKNVKISDYMPNQEYVSDGLVLRLDGIDNTGTGEHNNKAEYWTDLADLTGSTQIAINRENKEGEEGTNTFTDTALQLNASKVILTHNLPTVDCAHATAMRDKSSEEVSI